MIVAPAWGVQGVHEPRMRHQVCGHNLLGLRRVRTQMRHQMRGHNLLGLRRVRTQMRHQMSGQVKCPWPPLSGVCAH